MSLSTNKVVYRGYSKLNAEGKIEKLNVSAATKDEKNWKKLEADGAVQINQNEFVQYTVDAEDGFATLVPSVEQRVYIINRGLAAVQTAKSQAYMQEIEEDSVTPKYNDETIDLREAINEPPTRRNLSDVEKLKKTLESLGLSGDQAKAMLESLIAQMAPATEEAEG